MVRSILLLACVVSVSHACVGFGGAFIPSGFGSGHALCIPPETRTIASAGGRAVSLEAATVSPSGGAEVSRRVALVSAAALTVGSITSEAQAIDLEKTVRQLEFTNMLKKNAEGAPEKHLPQVTLKDGVVNVVVNHVMDPVKPHFILLMWLHDIQKNEIAVVKGFPAAGPAPPSLKVQVPPNVKLQPMIYCNLHGLWEGDTFRVSEAGELEFV